jgi:hypothetical protein
MNAHQLFVKHINPFGHQTSYPVPSILKNEEDEKILTMIDK